MIIELADDGGKVFVNRTQVVYVASIPAENDEQMLTLISLTGGQAFVAVTPFDTVVSRLAQDGLV